MSSSSSIASTRIGSPQQNDLLIGFIAGLTFECSICNAIGEECFCFCNKCRRRQHPGCAGVETGTVYGTDGRPQVVLPASERLPKSCASCIRSKATQMEDAITMMNGLFLRQNSLGTIIPSNSTSSSSINSFLVYGLAPPHKLKQGTNGCMIHEHKPDHQLRQNHSCTSYNCSGCKMAGVGLSFDCVNPSCSFRLHKECKSPCVATTHEFFAGVTFLFHGLQKTTSYGKHNKKSDYPNVLCTACGMDINGYHYHSPDGTYNFHPCCINLPRKTICGLNGATMVLRQNSKFNCAYCNERSMKLARNNISGHGWSYVAEDDNIQLHVRCVIKMMAELKPDSTGQIMSLQMTCENGEGRITLKLAVRETMMKWERKFKNFTKYAKIVLGAIISGLMGNATTLFVNTIVAVAS